jgi:hypothetical protein
MRFLVQALPMSLALALYPALALTLVLDFFSTNDNYFWLMSKPTPRSRKIDAGFMPLISGVEK